MINENFKQTIKIVQELLNKNNIKWAIIGSTNIQLQGMDVNPNDLDIVIKLKDLAKMPSIFSDYNVSSINELKPFANESTWEVKIVINNIEVQILGETDTGQYNRKFTENQLINIRLDGLEIPCFTLEAEAKVYSKTNRQHKANLIKEFLKNK